MVEQWLHRFPELYQKELSGAARASIPELYQKELSGL